MLKTLTTSPLISKPPSLDRSSLKTVPSIIIEDWIVNCADELLGTTHETIPPRSSRSSMKVFSFCFLILCIQPRTDTFSPMYFSHFISWALLYNRFRSFFSHLINPFIKGTNEFKNLFSNAAFNL